MSFKNLRPELQDILTKHNFVNGTEIQNKTLPYSLNKRDLIGISKTGSGKTLAFILPILNSLIKRNVSFHSLILIPTRELALQINDLLYQLGEDLGLRTSLLIGGEDPKLQKLSLNRNPHVLIGTPGRISEHSFPLKHLRFIVLDETDKLIEANFKNDILTIFNKLKKDKKYEKGKEKKNFQTFLFSATLKKDFESLIDEILFEPEIIEIKQELKINEFFLFIPHKYKIIYLIRLLSRYKPRSCIVFVNSSTATRVISKCLDENKMKNKFLYGDLDQTERKETIFSFRRGDFKILIATDLVSRGLDVPQVELIINFDISDAKTHVHRIGRTSRGERMGTAISLVSQYEIVGFQKIEFETQKKITNLVDDEKILEEEAKLVELFKEVKSGCKVIRKEEGNKKKKFKKKIK
ncbi:ATP-dependent rRNA helicase RRP3 [Cucumispora dikerogammari]|nr:ATP-dependent rRNA helicase RRP3 [Cucumispora dikerogammari]